jgi:hypothetical protein
VQVLPLALLLAFVLVITSTLLSVPVLLWGLDLASQGWTWVHCGLFSAIIASTDAVAGTGRGVADMISRMHRLCRGTSHPVTATRLVLYRKALLDGRRLVMSQ